MRAQYIIAALSCVHLFCYQNFSVRGHPPPGDEGPGNIIGRYEGENRTVIENRKGSLSGPSQPRITVKRSTVVKIFMEPLSKGSRHATAGGAYTCIGLTLFLCNIIVPMDMASVMHHSAILVGGEFYEYTDGGLFEHPFGSRDANGLERKNWTRQWKRSSEKTLHDFRIWKLGQTRFSNKGYDGGKNNCHDFTIAALEFLGIQAMVINPSWAQVQTTIWLCTTVTCACIGTVGSQVYSALPGLQSARKQQRNERLRQNEEIWNEKFDADIKRSATLNHI